ncbi:MAG: NADH-quinone oxidoreductase subunit C [Candidatus Riflebacteria bacterium]|nr:NADH-quinone oxidoreductase subunit C [Candidatus Riflebacteria bacterium]
MSYLTLKNAVPAPIKEVPTQEYETFKATIKELLEQECRLSSLFAAPIELDKRIFAVMTNDKNSEIYVFATKHNQTFESLTPEIPQAHWFEREIAETHNIKITNHPWLKPIRFQPKLGEKNFPTAGDTDYFKVNGEEIHEVGVGPIHAGVIEPGHFRFQCYGEKVLHLEIELGYQHRGIERVLPQILHQKRIKMIETASGDTTIGHTTAYALNIEGLANAPISTNDALVRSIALELERMANHTGDLGAMAGDIGFMPTSSYCGRIRGDILNTTGMICGNRFGRGLVKPASSGYRIDAELNKKILDKLDLIEADVKSAIDLIWQTPSVNARFDDTGSVSRENAVAIGLVGPAARAAGVAIDIRMTHPFDAFKELEPIVPVGKKGDVGMRAQVRWHELQNSFKLVRDMLAKLNDNEAQSEIDRNICDKLAPDMISVALTEGWRGEICHTTITDSAGKIKIYKIVDPSFHNWFGLALALRDQEISDFPLCNKSFNLSYCGHDL